MPEMFGAFCSYGNFQRRWDSYTQEQKDGAKKAFLDRNGFAVNNYAVSRTDSVLSEMNSSLKSIAKDFHFFKVLSVVWMIAMGVIFVLSFMVGILAAL